jgi:23S rRNA U2552 (ribose-2'-O)-methylase RlmE/FtsJ/NOL1/NOP2/fmu family ribosome biogenesis protein
MLPVEILNIQKDERVLDLCASPGGKTTDIAARLAGTGVVVANDQNPSRMAALVQNIERFGIKNALITNETPMRLAVFFGEYFHKILVDAPCSGEGMFRKDADSVKAWSPQKVFRLAEIQKSILSEAAKMLLPGGSLVYSTCTFNYYENENQIADFLKEHKNFELCKIEHDKLGVSAAADNMSARIFPHIQRGEGHFTALLKKAGETVLPEKTAVLQKKIGDMTYFHQFCNDNLNIDSLGLELCELGNSIFIPPPVEYSGLRVSRAGLLLGRIKEKRFVPSGAFALGLDTADFKRVIRFDETAKEVALFLSGQTFEVDVDDGYYAFAVNNSVIDFVKILNGRLKWRARNLR